MPSDHQLSTEWANAKERRAVRRVQAAELRRDGWTMARIAVELGCSSKTVHELLVEAGVHVVKHREWSPLRSLKRRKTKRKRTAAAQKVD